MGLASISSPSPLREATTLWFTGSMCLSPGALSGPSKAVWGRGRPEPLFPSAAPPDLLIFSLFSPHP